MNYRHRFHAGNFADVMKHVLLMQLVRAMQRKEKGFLFLDTHAGRGAYDLGEAARGDSLERSPEWPGGIGRLWPAEALSESLAVYREIVRQFDRENGGGGDVPRFYPGSPAIARALMRAQDRMALCEKHPEEFAALEERFCFTPRTIVREMDGYEAGRAMLPPSERRALVLIDPPFEAVDEFARVAGAIREGLARLAQGVFAVWYPLTERARIEMFFAELRTLKLPPTVTVEMTIAEEDAGLKMRGCGVLVVNPPWRWVELAEAAAKELAAMLGVARGGGARVEWLVEER